MVAVTARKIRDHSRERPGVGVGRTYTGFLISYPVVGRGMVISAAAILLTALAIGVAILAFVNSSAPTVITLTSGPAGSVFERNAERYKKILAREGVTLKILPSEGSTENFNRASCWAARPTAATLASSFRSAAFPISR